jgi:hypothetical protein
MAGLIESLLNDPGAQLGIGLLAAGGPSTTPMNVGQRVQMAMQGLNAQQQNALKMKLLQSQVDENASQNALRQSQLAAQQRRDAYFMGDGMGGGATAPAAGLPGSAGLPGGAPMAAPGVAAAGAPVAAGGDKFSQLAAQYGVPRDALVMDYMNNGGKGIAAMIEKRGTPNWQNVNGNLVDTNASGFKGGLQAGMASSADGKVTAWQPDGQGGLVVGAPRGALDTFSAYKSAEANLKPFKFFNPATQREEYTTEGAVVGGAPRQPMARTGNPLIDAVIQTESNGNPNAVSPKGAQGLMQVMPGTNAAPGFGVAPAKDGSETERTRVGQEYLTALNQKYQNPTLAAIAYNWGPGNTDAWIKSGGDYNKLPAETKNYVSAVMTRTAVNGLGGGQQSQPTPAGNYAAGPSTTEAATAKANEARMVDTAKADVVRDTGKTAEGKRAAQVSQISNLASQLLEQGPTASGVGSLVDTAANFVGQPLKSGTKAQQLEALSGWLVSNVPRMEGPQSNADVLNYQTMAGRVGDRTLPVEARKAALGTLMELQRKYAEAGTDSTAPNPAKPAKVLESLPTPNASNKGQRIRDTTTGKVLVSNGLQWKEE